MRSLQPCCNDIHGTAVAGIIGAQHNSVGGAGIAPGVELSAVRIYRRIYPPELNVFPFDESATPNEIADGINWAWARAFGSDVISNSWDMASPHTSITNAINGALTMGRNGKGTVVVFTSTFSGTSAAAPQVAAAALILVGEPALTAGQVKNRLSDAADNWGPSNYFGAGKLNIGRAVNP